MYQDASNEITNIINQLETGIKLPLKSHQIMDNELMELKARTLSMNPRSAMPFIRELEDSLSKAQYNHIWSFLHIFIAYSYWNLNDLHSARLAAEDSVRNFNESNDNWNAAIAQWFLAIIYREDGYSKDAKEQLMNAQKSMSKLIAHIPNDDMGCKFKTDCNFLINQLKQEIENTPSERTRLFDHPRRDQ